MSLSLSHKREFRVYVITKEDIFSFVVIEILIGSLAFSLASRWFHNALVAGAGSWAYTEGIKRIGRLKFLNG